MPRPPCDFCGERPKEHERRYCSRCRPPCDECGERPRAYDRRLCAVCLKKYRKRSESNLLAANRRALERERAEAMDHVRSLLAAMTPGPARGWWG